MSFDSLRPMTGNLPCLSGKMTEIVKLHPLEGENFTNSPNYLGCLAGGKVKIISFADEKPESWKG